MKKLYSLVMVTLLTVLCYATADAAPTKSRFKMPENVTLTEKGKEVLKQLASESSLLAESNSTDRKQVRKRVLDENGSGTIINFLLDENYVWRDLLLINGGQVEFTEFPYYIVIAQFGEARDRYWYNSNILPLFWPAKSELYGNSDYSCPSFDEMLDYIEEGGHGLFVPWGTSLSEAGEEYWPFWKTVGDFSWYPFVKGERIEIYDPYLPTTYLRLMGHGQEEDAVRLSWNVEYNKDAFQNCGITLDETVFSETLDEKPNYVFTPHNYDTNREFNYDELYLVGSLQGWNIDNGSHSLERVGSRVYEGILYFPAGDSQFRFYGRLGDWNKYSIGSCDYDEGSLEAIVNISLNDDPVTLPVYEYDGNLLGKSNWLLADFKGGLVKIRIDLDNKEMTMTPVDLGYDPNDFELTVRGLDDEYLYPCETKRFEVVVPEKYICDGFRLVYGVQNGSGYIRELNYRVEGDGENACRVYEMELYLMSYAEGSIVLYFTSNYAEPAGKAVELVKEVRPDNFAEYDIDHIEMVVLHNIGKGENDTFRWEEEIVPCELSEEGLYKWKYDFKYSEYDSYIYFYWYDTNGIKRDLFPGDGPTDIYNGFNVKLTGRRVMEEGEISFVYPAYQSEEFQFTIDPSTGNLRVKTYDPDYVPVLRIESDELVFIPGRTYDIKIVSSDEVVNYEIINSTINDWVDFWYSWREDDYSTKLSTLNYGFCAGGEGECDIRFTSEEGLELIVHVVVKDNVPEELWVSDERLQMHVGEYAILRFGINPDSSHQPHCYQQSGYDVCNFMDLNVNGARHIFALKEGTATFNIEVDDYPNLTKQVVVEVLPKGAAIAEHVAYSYMKLGETRVYYLSRHSDGTEASAEWSSSDPTVAEVDANGNVVAKGNGRALITAHCGGHATVFGVHVDDSVTVGEVEASNVSVYSVGRSIVVAGAPEGETVRVFNSDGVTAASRIANGTALRFEMDAPGVYLLTVGNESFKVATK